MGEHCGMNGIYLFCEFFDGLADSFLFYYSIRGCLYSILILNLLMIITLFLIFTVNNKSVHSQILIDNYETQKIVIKQQKETIDNIKKIQHEYKNNINTINLLLVSHKYNTLEKFMEQIFKVNNYTGELIKSSDSFINILATYKMEEARQKNIKTSFSINTPINIPIDEYDIAVVLNNALNNAIECCEKVPEADRYIKCSIFLKLNYLNLYFENACLEALKEKDGVLFTTKQDKVNHGIGLQNVKYVINKYHGLMEYRVKDRKFILKCSLVLESEYKNINLYTENKIG